MNIISMLPRFRLIYGLENTFQIELNKHIHSAILDFHLLGIRVIITYILERKVSAGWNKKYLIYAAHIQPVLATPSVTQQAALQTTG